MSNVEIRIRRVSNGFIIESAGNDNALATTEFFCGAVARTPEELAECIKAWATPPRPALVPEGFDPRPEAVNWVRLA